MARMALASLIDDTEARNEWRDTKVAEQAKDRGHTLTKSDISYYRTNGMRTLKASKVLALAAGLQVPPYRVALAVLEDLGIGVPLDVRSPEEAISHDHTLSALTRRHLLAMLREDRG